MKEGEVRDINGNFRRFVEYTTCASMENAVRKKGNLSNIRSRTWIPIITWD
jgi:hypothetical protein